MHRLPKKHKGCLMTLECVVSPPQPIGYASSFKSILQDALDF